MLRAKRLASPLKTASDSQPVVSVTDQFNGAIRRKASGHLSPGRCTDSYNHCTT